MPPFRLFHKVYIYARLWRPGSFFTCTDVVTDISFKKVGLEHFFDVFMGVIPQKVSTFTSQTGFIEN